MMNMQKILESLDRDTQLTNGRETFSAERWLEVLDGSDELAEPAIRQGNEIYLTTESGDMYTAADPAYTIVE